MNTQRAIIFCIQLSPFHLTFKNIIIITNKIQKSTERQSYIQKESFKVTYVTALRQDKTICVILYCFCSYLPGEAAAAMLCPHFYQIILHVTVNGDEDILRCKGTEKGATVRVMASKEWELGLNWWAHPESCVGEASWWELCRAGQDRNFAVGPRIDGGGRAKHALGDM